MRARRPEVSGSVVRDGVTLGYEVSGEGEPAVLLLPTWTIIHSRFWKFQVPYFARRHRVITYDGPGNGRSDRVTDPARYGASSYAADAAAVLDACEVDKAVVVGLSMGGQYGPRLAALHPHRVAGLVLIGPALPLVPPSPEREAIGRRFLEPYPAEPRGWDKYNLAYWHDHYADFAQFFFEQCFSEPHSTKAIEDAVGWSAETTPVVLEAEAKRPSEIEGSRSSVDALEQARTSWSQVLRDLQCPVLVVHGTDDRIQPHAAGVAAAELAGGTLVSMEGAGHIPNVRHPVAFNLILRDFIDKVAA